MLEMDKECNLATAGQKLYMQLKNDSVLRKMYLCGKPKRKHKS